VRIETLPADRGRRQKRKRVGRGPGSGTGQTSGRGTKGFQARAGSTRRLGHEGGQMPLIQRLPKRGFYPVARVEYCAVNIGQLEARFAADATIDPAALHAARLVRKKDVPVKILATGTLRKPLHVRAHAFSAAARQKILDAGGHCELIETRREMPSRARRQKTER
jgi:large subunit ribosomal protein L15